MRMPRRRSGRSSVELPGALFLFASSIGSTAALARFFMDTLAAVWPAVAPPLVNFIVLVLMYGGLAFVNIIGARDGNRLTIAIGILKFVPLALLIVVGAFYIDPVNLVWMEFPSIERIGDGALILFFAFIGIEGGLSISGEARNPARTIPRAIALALIMVSLLYIGLQNVTQGVLGAVLAGSTTPLVDTARILLGSRGAQLFVTLTLVSAGGYLAADMLGSPRIVHALAVSRQLPHALSAVHIKFRTPAVAIAAYSIAVIAVTVSGSFRQIAVLAVAGTLVLYLICCLGVLQLRARYIATTEAPFVAPGGAVIPIAASLLILWLLGTLAWREMIATFVFIALTATIYYIRSRHCADGEASSLNSP